MRSRSMAAAAAAAVMAAAGLGAAQTPDPLMRLARMYGFAPAPAFADLDAREVALGELLFHDGRLSANGAVSCASCHDIAGGGGDGRARSIGVSGAPSAVNSPSVIFAGHQFAQFWDGRAATLEDQIDGPVEHPDEMAISWDGVVARIEAEDAYVTAFRDIYGAGAVTPDRIRSAIAAFERSLAGPDSAFDRFLEGDADAISEQAKAGFEAFIDAGCASCHQGPLLGGNLFQKVGVMHDYFADRGDIQTADYGRFNVTGDEADRYYFKVPPLRNVAVTAPYFHDGSIETLEAAVDMMAYYQLGARLDDDERAAIVAFFETLTSDRAAVDARAAAGRDAP